MKRQEKLEVIRRGIENVEICRCYFTFDQWFWYCYPNKVNEKFILGQEEDDFILDGYFIRRIPQLRKVEIKTDKCNEINRMLGIAAQVAVPDVDISSWRSIFESLAKLDEYIIIEDNINRQFAIGEIEKVLKDRLYFRRFDADGIWDENSIEIRYSTITSVEWASRYALGWKQYHESGLKQAGVDA